MERRVVEEIIIPAGYGRACEVKKGQVLRIFQPEGKQVGDCAFFNAHDYKEVYHVGQTWGLNGILGTGNARHFKYFFSKPPRENIMFTVLEDTVKNHWGNNGGRCSPRIYEYRDKTTSHRSCQQNLEEALAPYGITGDDIMDIFNVFMNVEWDGDGNHTIRPTTAEKDDYIDMQAEMDILAAISSCPSEKAATNHYSVKPLGIRILE